MQVSLYRLDTFIMNDPFSQVGDPLNSHEQPTSNPRIEALGGEILEGTGFEEETPEMGFEEAEL